MLDDPAERIRAVRATIAEQNAKMPRVDHNGHPVAGFHTTGPNVTGHPAAEPSHQGVRAAAEILAEAQAHDAAGGAPQQVSVPPQGTTPVEALRPGALPMPTPQVPTLHEQAQQALREGRVRDALSIINRPIREASELGISVQQWHHQYANCPPLI